MKKTGKKSLILLFGLFMTMAIKAQVHPGMKVEEFRRALPKVVPDKVYYNEELSHAEKLYAFNGSWYLDFKHDTLRSVNYSQELGMHAKGDYHASFDSLVKKYTALMGEFAWKKMSADTSMNEHRKRRENWDSIRVVCWKTRYADVTMGLYFTGNRKIKMTAKERAAENLVNAEGPRNYYVFRIDVQKADHRGEAFSWSLYPGLNVYKVMELKPAYFPKGIGLNGQWANSETFYGLKGKWSYTFENSVLNACLWDYYAGRHDKETFEKCLKATQGIIEQYTQKYGTPVIVTGDTKYRDPAKKIHWGYEVIKASWDMKTYTIVVEYRFMGGKGQYDLLVKIEEQLK
jgi:hypothetical protein